MFNQIAKIIDENGRSAQAYEKAIQAADKAMTGDPGRAIGYRMLIVAADRYIESTERLPVTTLQTNASYEFFAKHAKALQSAFDGDGPQHVITALNKLAIATRADFDPTVELSNS